MRNLSLHRETVRALSLSAESGDTNDCPRSVDCPRDPSVDCPKSATC